MSLTSPLFKPLRTRTFSTSARPRASVLFALSALSNSRETQHFNKITRLPRIEHSPPLKLIKSSEVDPFPCPNPPRAIPRPLDVRAGDPARSTARVWDQKALQVGRVVLAEQARRTHRLAQSLARAKKREAKMDLLARRERAVWRSERDKMGRDLRTAGIWILLSIGTATALATWRFWPETVEGGRESGELGRKIAARAKGAMMLPPAVVVEPTLTAPIAVPDQVPPSTTPKLPPAVDSPVGGEQALTAAEVVKNPTGGWWRNLFWKQE